MQKYPDKDSNNVGMREGQDLLIEWYFCNDER
jgi:hypothetical protein